MLWPNNGVANDGKTYVNKRGDRLMSKTKFYIKTTTEIFEVCGGYTGRLMKKDVAVYKYEPVDDEAVIRFEERVEHQKK